MVIVDRDRELLRELLEMFPRQIGALLAAVKGAVARGDRAALRLVAHQLKGALSNFAAKGAAALAGRLEEMGRAGDLTAAEGVVDELGREIARVQAALDQIVS